MADSGRRDLNAIEQRVCEIASQLLNIPREQVSPVSRMIEDLQCDSLDLVELVMELEKEFLITVPDHGDNAVGKAIFTRRPFRLGDLAELVCLLLASDTTERQKNRHIKIAGVDCSGLLFSQLSGRWENPLRDQRQKLFEPLGNAFGVRQFRRHSDGMRCALLPSAEIEIGSNEAVAQPDEQPVHTVQLDSFLMDREPVSTTAYCRFLNSVGVSECRWQDWFLLAADDDRIAQMPIVLFGEEWCPVRGAETLPMVLVSWYGANAYSLWANGADWPRYQTEEGFLPSEAQWEYAAQEAYRQGSFVCEQHQQGTAYEASTMPMQPVHVPLGCSSFGLHHMAGNVWQWCRDWYTRDFYLQPESRVPNPVNTRESGIRSERGGSWVGPADLCRPTYRRGRNPAARGRCLGFRCISPVEYLNQ